MIFHRYFVTVVGCDWASGITITLIRGRKGTSGPYFFKSVTLDGPGGLSGPQYVETFFQGAMKCFFNDYFINLQTNQITNMVSISCQYVHGGFTNPVMKHSGLA